MHKHQRLNHYLFRPTTFFPDLDVPVKMNETEEVFGPKPNGESPSTSHSNYLIPNTYIQDENAKSKNDLDCQVELLKRIKYEKQRLNKEDTKLTYHYGFKVLIAQRMHLVFKNQIFFSVTFVVKSQLREHDGIVPFA